MSEGRWGRRFRSAFAREASFGATAFACFWLAKPKLTRRRSKLRVSEGWRKRLGVEPSPPALSGERPILKTGRATGPRSLP